MNHLRLSYFAVLCLVVTPYGHAATVNQLDDFQSDTTTLGWDGSLQTPFTGPPSRQPGGAGGAGDYYLQQQTGGFHMAVRNDAQWSGDYLGAGIGAIEMDINHLSGFTPMSLRVAVTGPGGFFSSTDPTPIAFGQWGRYLFGVTASDLVYVSGGTGNLADTLSAVSKLVIRHDPFDQPTPPGAHPPHVAATMGFDNILAIAEAVTAGDTNNDDIVDDSDLENLIAQFGGPPGSGSADFNGDGIVDLEDFATMRGNFGFGLSSSPGVEATPEPATIAFLALGGLAFLRRRNR